MKPSKIIFIRHGESEGNVDHTTYFNKPDYSIELTPKGIQQAKNVGKELALDLGKKKFSTYISPYFRTRRTWKFIKQSLSEDNICREEETPLIREQEWNTGVQRHEIDHERERYKVGAFYYRFPHGESCADCYNRAAAFFLDLFENNQEDCAENVVVVSHGMMIRILVMRLLKLTVEEFEKLRNPKNCEKIVLIYKADGNYALEKPMMERLALPHNFTYVDEI